MKKMLVVLVLMVVVTVGQSFAQGLASVERQIKKAKSELAQAEKKFEVEKTRKVFSLQREAKQQTLIGSRADDANKRDAAGILVKKLNEQADSVSKLVVTADQKVKDLTKALYEVQQEKIQLTAQSKPTKLNISAKDSTATVPTTTPMITKTPKADPMDRSIPTRLSRLNRNQRSRSHSTRLDELVITKVEENLNAAINPSGRQSGYKVIFDNMYVEPVNFIARQVGGIGEFSTMIPPKSMEVNYLLPGVYMIEIYINGRRSGEPRKMTIDGQEKKYQGMSCFNYAVAPRFP
ncbi:MAG: hypothetical protein WCT50_02245 [Patescibacteria group bacterium]